MGRQPLVRDFVAKEEGFDAVLLSVGLILGEQHQQKVDYDLLLKQYMEEGLAQSRITHRWRIRLIVISFVIIILGTVIGMLLGNLSVSVISGVAGLFVTSVNGFFTKSFEKGIHTTLERYVDELIKLRNDPGPKDRGQ